CGRRHPLFATVLRSTTPPPRCQIPTPFDSFTFHANILDMKPSLIRLLASTAWNAASWVAIAPKEYHTFLGLSNMTHFHLKRFSSHGHGNLRTVKPTPRATRSARRVALL